MNLAKGCFALLMTTAMFLGGCATTSTTSSQADAATDILRVGVAPELPPLVFKKGSEYVGLEPDLAQALAADMGKTVQFVEVRWDKLIDALLAGKVDIIMSGMTITEGRLMRVNFTKPYLRSGQSVLVRLTDAPLIQMSLLDVKTRVGAQKATTGDFWVKENCPKQERKLFRTAEQGARALIDKKIDAFICDAPINWWLASEHEGAGLTVAGGYLTEEYIGWAVRREDKGLLEAANRFIDEKKASGELQAILKNWIPYL